MKLRLLMPLPRPEWFTLLLEHVVMANYPIVVVLELLVLKRYKKTGYGVDVEIISSTDTDSRKPLLMSEKRKKPTERQVRNKEEN